MESFYQIIAMLTAGISICMGFLSLLTFLYNGREKLYLLYGIMCLLVLAFILLPPVGFILNDSAPYSSSIKLKRVFNLSFLGLLPWFIASYTGYQKRMVPLIATASIIICYLVMFVTASNGLKQLWLLLALISMVLILAHGFYAAYQQYITGQKKKATWLFVALVLFGFFNLFGAISQFEKGFFTREWVVIFLPINLCPLAFMIITGSQLLKNNKNEFRLQKILGSREAQWKTLMDNMQAIVVKTCTGGKIQYINPYGVNLLSYHNTSEILNTAWSDYCLPEREAGNTSTNAGLIMPGEDGMTIKKNMVLTKDGKEKIISWHCHSNYNDDGQLVGSIDIGSDITEQEETLRQVKELRAQLEKETLVTKKTAVTSGLHKGIIGSSRPFMYAIGKCKQVAHTNASVLLLGETGVGKECFADLIQETSLRSNKPFIKVNCGALPAELIEDELFGHEKGAFTGALQSRMGRFEKANGGTIFLDEIGELPLLMQPKLLRVLQNGEFERVGGHQTIKVDVRVIAATNNDLEKEVREGRFRDDLFYRLNVFPITIPPLRKRGADITLLIQHLIEMKCLEHDKHFDNISKADMNRLCDYEWPGNIRELKNVIERAVISSENQTLKLDWFYEDIEKNAQPAYCTSLEEVETAHIIKVLKDCSWKINGDKGAAEKLVMHPNTLRSRMKKLNINVPWKQE